MRTSMTTASFQPARQPLRTSLLAETPGMRQPCLTGLRDIHHQSPTDLSINPKGGAPSQRLRRRQPIEQEGWSFGPRCWVGGGVFYRVTAARAAQCRYTCRDRRVRAGSPLTFSLKAADPPSCRGLAAGVGRPSFVPGCRLRTPPTARRPNGRGASAGGWPDQAQQAASSGCAAGPASTPRRCCVDRGGVARHHRAAGPAAAAIGAGTTGPVSLPSVAVEAGADVAAQAKRTEQLVAGSIRWAFE